MIKEALEAYAKARERTWPHDRRKSVGASEIGQCARKTWFSKHDTAVDNDYLDRWGAKTRGHLIEDFWQKALRQHFGLGHVHYAGRYQKTFFDDASPLSATPDAVVVVPEKKLSFVTDCKSLDPRAAMHQARPEHVFQVQVQLGLVRSQTRYQPAYGVLTYIDASFLDEIKEHIVKWDAGVFEQARERARQIMTHEDPARIKPEGVIAGGAECEYCPYRSRCAEMRAGAVPKHDLKVAHPDMHEISRLAHARGRAKDEIERLEMQAKGHEQAIKELLQKNGTRRAEGDGVRVVWSSIKGRPSWDWPGLRSAAESAGLDLATYERVGDPSDRLQVTL